MNHKKLPLLKRKSGFTLVELMVSMGIIGILMAIAVPTASRYRKFAQRMECRLSIINFLRAQELYFLDNDCYYPLNSTDPGKDEKTIGWGKDDSLPDDPEGYRFKELGIEFRRDSHRRYKIKYEHKEGAEFRKELRFEFKTDEDFDNDGDDDHYRYIKRNWQKDDGSGTDGEWDIFNEFWFEINSVPAYTDVLPSAS